MSSGAEILTAGPAPVLADPGDRAVAAPWPVRLLDAASAYLPLLLMALLALGTWWLVKNTPLFDIDRAPAPLRHEPDYTMSQFMVQRFAPDGAMRVQIEGDLMRHYPDTDTLEIDNPRIRSLAPDGRVTRGSAGICRRSRSAALHRTSHRLSAPGRCALTCSARPTCSRPLRS